MGNGEPLGVFLGCASISELNRFGMKSTNGPVIRRVIPESPADIAGVITGDMILEVDGTPKALYRKAAQINLPGDPAHESECCKWDCAADPKKSGRTCFEDMSIMTSAVHQICIEYDQHQIRLHFSSANLPECKQLFPSKWYHSGTTKIIKFLKR